MVRAVGKKKICWNCEGDVPREAVNCPYCAVYLHPEEDQFHLEEDDDDNDHSPPYQIHSASENEDASMFVNSKESSSAGKNEDRGSGHFIITFTGWKSVAVPLISLLFGTLFLLFAFLLLVFSQEGVLTLQWKSELWWIYGLIALPLIFLGWKTLQSVDG